MANSYLQQTSTLCAVLPGVIPQQNQMSNQLSSIVTDITNLFHAVNGLKGSGGVGSSWFQTQNVVTGQRALNTIYQNTTGKTMFINVTNNISSTSSVTAYTDLSLNPSTNVGAVNITATKVPISFMVINNNYYTLTTTGTVSLVTWTEWS
jgi:hypothetical protein